MLETLDFIFLSHLSFPAIELGGVLEAHRHLVKLSLCLPLILIDQVLFALQGCHVKFDICLVLLEVGHRARLVSLELEFPHDGLFHFLLDLRGLGYSWTLLCGQGEALLKVALVLALDGIDGGLTTLLFVSLNVSQSLLIHVLGHRPSFDLSLDLFWSWDHFRLRLGQIERLELRAFRFFLLFCPLGHQLRHPGVMGGHGRLSKTTHRGLLMRAH